MSGALCPKQIAELLSGPGGGPVIGELSKVHGIRVTMIDAPAPEPPSMSVDVARRIAVRTKHGPMASGRSGPCEPDCLKCDAERVLKRHVAEAAQIGAIDADTAHGVIKALEQSKLDPLAEQSEPQPAPPRLIDRVAEQLLEAALRAARASSTWSEAVQLVRAFLDLRAAVRP